jgi:hypothetical protein
VDVFGFSGGAARPHLAVAASLCRNRLIGLEFPTISDLAANTPKQLTSALCRLVKVPVTVTPCTSLTERLGSWAARGIPSSPLCCTSLRVLQAIILAWLFPDGGRRAMKHSKGIWQLYFVVQFVAGLAHLVHFNGKKQYLRVYMRGFAPYLHCRILYRIFDSRWRDFVYNILDGVLWPRAFAQKNRTFVYGIFSMENSTWYAGKTEHTRHGTGKPCLFGPVARLREHLCEAIWSGGRASHRPQYVHWRGTAAHRLHMIPPLAVQISPSLHA